MHEIRIAEDLTAIVLDTAARERLSRVTKVNVTFGQLIQIVPEIFRFAFSETVRNSPAEGADLEIEIVKVSLRCRVCSKEFGLNDNLFSCSACGSDDIEIVTGKELYVKSIEGE